MSDKVILGETLKGAKAELDLQELITGRTLLCSISRFGKTWTARRIVEQVFGKTGIIVVDIEGEYATLRDKYPLLIIGKDVPLVPESAEFLADTVLDHSFSAIIDLSDPELDIATGQEFVSRFIGRFIARETLERKAYLWILEEADELAPETGISKSICLEQVRKLVKKGGKRGMGALVLTQRPAFVSKFVISQCPNKLIGRTEWPDDLAVLRKFGRIPERLADPESKDPHALKNLRKGEFYVSGDFVARDELVKVGPVETKHLGATPEVVPPAPAELKEVLKQLNEKLPEVIKEKLEPAIPKVKEMEARVKEKFEAQWMARVEREKKEKERIRAKTEARYETEIADLNRKLDEATRHAAMAGPVTDIMDHPLVKKNLEKLSPKQRSVVELLEAKGPQDAEHLSLFLSINPRSVPDFVHEVNRKIPKLVENLGGGRYASRLVKLFPVTEEAQAEQREVEELRNRMKFMQESLDGERSAHHEEHEQLLQLKKDLMQAENNQKVLEKERDHFSERLLELQRKLEEANITPTRLPEFGIVQGERPWLEGPPPEVGEKEHLPPATPTEGPPYIGVEATLKRKLTVFELQVSTERLEVDESSWTGKILAKGVKGFFAEEKGFGQIMNELERVYSASKTSGGTRKAVQDSLDELCAKGILAREQKAGQWMYIASPEFKDRVKRA